MLGDSFFQPERVTERLWAIRSATGEIMYLLVGTNRALLIDTCLGVGNLRKTVEEITQLPLTVVITHGHVDHAMGAPLFEDVYMNPTDNEVFLEHSPLEVRQDYLEGNLGAAPGSWHDADWVAPVAPHFKELTDGMVFDLGDRRAEVYALPGHTPGSMVVLLVEERILITGDAANNSTFLFDEWTLPVERYRDNVRAVANRLQGRYDCCFIMHHVMEASEDLLDNVARVCDDILAGNTDDQLFVFQDNRYCIAKAATRDFRRLDGGEGNIIYDKNRMVLAR